MKRVAAIILAFSMLLSLTACNEENHKKSITDKDKNTLINTAALFPSAEMFTYDGGASVREYTVLPGLSNIVNKNQFRHGTNYEGDYYFALELSEEASSLIEQNGFAVCDCFNHDEYYSQYERNRYNYIPSFITTDSAVHTFHLMYDYVLKDVERSSLMKCLKKLSYNMTETSYQQYLDLKGTEFENAAFRNVAFFSVGGKLIDNDFNVKQEVSNLVDKELALIKAHSNISSSPIINYGETYTDLTQFYNVDYTQFTPRGHYTQSKELEDYFKSSMWYGQMTFRSEYPDEVRSALLMTSAVQTAENAHDWNNIFQTINFFVGECDDITPVDYCKNLSKVYGKDIDSLKTITDNKKFDQALKVIKTLPPPAINSIPILDDELQPNKDKAITGFRFLGQRFTIDSSIFQRLIDRETVNRMLPNSLDIPAAFGSDEAYNILKSDYDVKKYSDYDKNLSNVIKHIDTIEDNVWTSNLYWSWLNMLRPLTSNDDKTGYPFFMQNNAWTRKELNTFLGSWTELKHDTLLYTKQAMAEMGGGGEEPIPPDDRGYVEPNPELFGRLALLVKQTKGGLETTNLITDEAYEALEKLYSISNKLTEISQKELSNTQLTSEDYNFIRNYGGELEHIWDCAKKDELEALEADYGYADKNSYLYHHPDAVVADVATDPDKGICLEEATGYAKTIVVAFPRENDVVLGVGVVYSQYEFTVPINNRMTDNKWHEALRNKNVPDIPSWKNAFIIK